MVVFRKVQVGPTKVSLSLRVSPSLDVSPRVTSVHYMPKHLWRMAMITALDYFLQGKPLPACDLLLFMLKLQISIYHTEFLTTCSNRMLRMNAASLGHKQVKDKDMLLPCFKDTLIFMEYEPAGLKFYEPIRSTGWVQTSSDWKQVGQ